MKTISVECSYLERELMRVEFAGSQVVSDHPAQYGGTGKGPSPGELLVAAMVSSGVIALRAAARERGIALSSIVVRGALRVDREGFEGPLASLAIVSRLARRFELAGALSPQQAAALVGDDRLAATIRHPASIDESVDFAAGSGAYRAPEWTNPVLRATETSHVPLAQGERARADDSDWRIHAAELAPGLALVHLSGGPLVVSDDGRFGSVTPRELVLASLAACTTIYVARNAQFRDLPVEAVRVTVSAEEDAGEGARGARLTKRTLVTGDLSPAERDTATFFADHCAIGESMLRGIDLHNEIFIAPALAAGGSSDAVPPALAQLAASEPICGDASCCVT